MSDKKPLGGMPPINDSLPQASERSKQFYNKSLQGKGINGLISSFTGPNYIQMDAITHTGVMKSDGVLITIDEEAILDISSQTFKTLIILLTDLTAQLPHNNAITAEAIQKGRTVFMPLSKYMDICKTRDVKEARAQLNDAIRALYFISLEWDEEVWEKPEGKSRRAKTTKHHRLRITDHTITEEEGKPVKRGVAEFKFSFDMAEYMSGCYIMPYSKALLSINTHNHPYSIPLGWKLSTLYNINYGKKNANTTTVKTLLNAAKGIPRYADIAQHGHIYERIIARLDRDLAALVEVRDGEAVLSTYWYFTDDGTRIDGGYYKDGKYIESGKLALLSYKDFSALNVHFELKDYPDQTPRLEAKSKRIKAAISRKRTAAKKKTDTGDGA